MSNRLVKLYRPMATEAFQLHLLYYCSAPSFWCTSTPLGERFNRQKSKDKITATSIDEISSLEKSRFCKQNAITRADFSISPNNITHIKIQNFASTILYTADNKFYVFTPGTHEEVGSLLFDVTCEKSSQSTL